MGARAWRKAATWRGRMERKRRGTVMEGRQCPLKSSTSDSAIDVIYSWLEGSKHRWCGHAAAACSSLVAERRVSVSVFPGQRPEREAKGQGNRTLAPALGRQARGRLSSKRAL